MWAWSYSRFPPVKFVFVWRCLKDFLEQLLNVILASVAFRCLYKSVVVEATNRYCLNATEAPVKSGGQSPTQSQESTHRSLFFNQHVLIVRPACFGSGPLAPSAAAHSKHPCVDVHVGLCVWVCGICLHTHITMDCEGNRSVLCVLWLGNLKRPLTAALLGNMWFS